MRKFAVSVILCSMAFLSANTAFATNRSFPLEQNGSSKSIPNLNRDCSYALKIAQGDYVTTIALPNMFHNNLSASGVGSYEQVLTASIDRLTALELDKLKVFGNYGSDSRAKFIEFMSSPRSADSVELVFTNTKSIKTGYRTAWLKLRFLTQFFEGGVIASFDYIDLSTFGKMTLEQNC